MLRRLRAVLPPVRLVWLILLGLGGYGVWFLGGSTGIAPLLAFPLVAVVLDLAFDRVRFETLRFPDAALATGLFVALLLPPVVPLAAGLVAVFVAISAKHILRWKGRPWWNPAVTGALFVGLFGYVPGWWGAMSEPLVIALGLTLLLWNLPQWRLSVTFLGMYAGLAVLARVLATVGTSAVPPAGVLLLTAFDPAVLFFGFFMVSEPRAAPPDPRAQPIFGAVVAAGASLLPLLLSSTFAPLLALWIGNLVALGLRSWSPTVAPAPAARPSAARAKAAARSSRKAAPVPARWGVPRRVGAGVAVGIVLLVAATAVFPALSSSRLAGLPGGGASAPTGPNPTTSCKTDNPNISASTLTELHRLLGPSVIISYNSNNGVVVFYDTVNKVTVTETDLYEDFGYAEFNGDDYAVAGCSP